jgi:hypothetical protein
MVSELEKLRKQVHALVKKSLHGHALLAEGLHKRKASKRASKRSHKVGHAMLAEGRKPKKGTKRGTKRPMRRRVNHAGHNALAEINHIARQLKKQDPHMEHKEAISQASAHYRGEAIRHHRPVHRRRARSVSRY